MRARERWGEMEREIQCRVCVKLYMFQLENETVCRVMNMSGTHLAVRE